MGDTIRIRGLKEFIRSVKALDRELPKAVRVANNEAADVIVRAAKPKVPLGPGRGGHARDSLKARSTRTEVRIAAGGARFPYYPWLDFGGAVGRNRSVRRPFYKTGRYIFPALAEHRDELIAVHERALQTVIDQAGLG